RQLAGQRRRGGLGHLEQELQRQVVVAAGAEQLAEAEVVPVGGLLGGGRHGGCEEEEGGQEGDATQGWYIPGVGYGRRRKVRKGARRMNPVWNGWPRMSTGLATPARCEQRRERNEQPVVSRRPATGVAAGGSVPRARFPGCTWLPSSCEA